MYRVTGEAIKIQKPEMLVGQYGMRHDCRYETTEATIDRTVTATSTDLGWLNSQRVGGDFPFNTPIVEISTAEDAVPFISPEKVDVDLLYKSLPEWSRVVQSIREQNPDYTLLQATLRLWQEARFPAHWFYFYVNGTILDAVDVDADGGISRKYNRFEGGYTGRGMGVDVSLPGGVIFKADHTQMKTNYTMLAVVRIG